MKLLSMDDVELAGKRVLIREDLNVPIKDGEVASAARLRAALPTIKKAIEAGARVMVMAHLGRPTEGQPTEADSLAPVARWLSDELGFDVPLIKDWLDGVEVAEGELVICENVRFNVGEKANDEDLSQAMGGLCDVFVMDAFGTAHRAQASTEGVARHAPVACAGPLLMAEVEALTAAMDNPKRPLVVVVGGSKVSSKLSLLKSLSTLADQLIVGGGIANTFLAAAGHDVGASLHEADLVDEARAIHADIRERGGDIPLPQDVVVATELSENATAHERDIDSIGAEEMILDIGTQARETVADILKSAGTIVWNGPVGVFEIEAFGGGTKALSDAIAASDAFSIAGGGDTLAAIEKYDVADDVSYISTGGGAFLEFLEGKTLPAIAVLADRAREH